MVAMISVVTLVEEDDDEANAMATMAMVSVLVAVILQIGHSEARTNKRPTPHWTRTRPALPRHLSLDAQES